MNGEHMTEFALCAAFLCQEALWYIVGYNRGHRRGMLDTMALQFPETEGDLSER